MPLAMALPLADEIARTLRAVPGVEAVFVAGSLRRCKETVGDIDIVAVARESQAIMNAFTTLPNTVDVHEKGEVKASIRHKAGVDVDLRVTGGGSLGATLQYLTGSKDHNVALRRLALEKGLRLNEYGLFQGEQKLAGEDEEGIYRSLGLSWVPPELRENTGEVQAAATGRLPHLVQRKDLKGDLQTQTDWTDGANSILDMARAAKSLGLQYILITDHTKTLAMTGGLDEEGLRRQMEEINRLNKSLDSFRILKGAEVNILKDGTLDIDDSTLRELDVVGAAVHTSFNLPKGEMTKRMRQAMENPHVDILFHPTGRILLQRPPYDVDIEAIIDTAKSTGTILEIDAYPERLDLKDDYIRMAVNQDVNLCIDSDAHSKEQIAYLEYGVMQARRGWASKEHIVNTQPAESLLRTVKRS